MECDTDHSLIEKQKKKFNGQLEHPHDWANLIRQTGKKKPFIVKLLERNNFYNFSGLLNRPLINRKTDTNGDKINWRELRWIRYEKGSQTLLAKTTFSQNEPFRVLDFKRRGKQTVNLRPQVAYKGPVPISVEKKQHLLDLLPYISSSLQDFYLNLKTDQDVIDALSDSDEDEA
nr:unnamed protein product [Callosobruchus chinensis]